MRIEQLSLDEHRLLKALARVGPQYSSYSDAGPSLREKGLAVLDPKTNKLIATEEGQAIGRQRVLRRAG